MQNKLHFAQGTISVPFLSEGQIKKNAFGTEEAKMDAEMSSPVEDKYKKDFEELVEMGFTREKVAEALKLCDGNKEHAINYLFGSS